MQQPTDREAIAALVHRLYRMLDTHDYRDMDEILAPDARMSRLGQVHEGRAAISAAFAKRPATLRTRHLVSNLLSGPGRDGLALGRFTMTVVRAHAPADAPLPIPVRSAWRVSDVEACFVQSAAGWRIVSLATSAQFEFDPTLAVQP